LPISLRNFQECDPIIIPRAFSLSLKKIEFIFKNQEETKKIVQLEEVPLSYSSKPPVSANNFMKTVPLS
jgi:hypothetical protein